MTTHLTQRVMADLPGVVFKAEESATDPLIPSDGKVSEAGPIHLSAKFPRENLDPDPHHCDLSYVALNSKEFEASTATSVSDDGKF